MDIRDFARLIRKSWIVLLIGLLAGTAVSGAYVLVQTPTYESTAKVFVATQSASTVSDLSQGNSFVQQVVQSYADVVATPIVLDPVISELNLHTTAEQLAQRVSASAATDTVVLQISATDRSPAVSAEIANAVSRSLTEVVAKLSPAGTTADAAVKITRIQAATTTSQTKSPRVSVDVTIGAVLGLLVGLLFAFGRDRFDTRIHGRRDVEALTTTPILGSIPFDLDAKIRPLIVHVEPQGRRAESFRSLRTNLQFLVFDHDSRSMVISSSIESEGKSTSAANLAITIADSGADVILVDADLRRPKLSEYLGLDGSVGLTDVLVGNVSLDDAIHDWGEHGLRFLPAGQIPPNPSELLQSRAMMDLISELEARFGTVIFDAPPLLPVTDAAILARRTSGAMLVCAAGRTTKQQLRSAVGSLESVEANILGVILTMVPTKGPDSYGYGYGYSYGYKSEDPTLVSVVTVK